MNRDRSPQIIARSAGFAYLVTFVAGVLAFLARGNAAVMTNLVASIAYVVVTLLFYEIFKPVNRLLSLLAAGFGLAGCAVSIAGTLHLASIPINPLAIFGVYCLLIGYLIVRSTFLPHVLGFLMALGGVGWLTFVSPPLAKSLSPFVMLPGVIGEGALTLWLLVFGVNAVRWRTEAGSDAPPLEPLTRAN